MKTPVRADFGVGDGGEDWLRGVTNYHEMFLLVACADVEGRCDDVPVSGLQGWP